MIDGVRITTYTNAALAFVASGEISVGSLYVEPGIGSVTLLGCTGGDGFAELHNTQCRIYGSGGGGHATSAARGGGIDVFAAGGAGGSASGTETLVPLRGGCDGGGFDETNGPHTGGLAGGGAIQLSSRERITVTGTIDVTGGQLSLDDPPGGSAGCGIGTNGGGGGGGILLEAPVVRLENNAQLIARGGNGWGQPVSQPSPYFGVGGSGATHVDPATPGGDATYSSSQTYLSGGGGGGGGLGRVRINTADGVYDKASSATEDAVITVGVVGTR